MWFCPATLQDLTKMINEKNESNAAGKAQQSGGQLKMVSPSAAGHQHALLHLQARLLRVLQSSASVLSSLQHSAVEHWAKQQHWNPAESRQEQQGVAAQLAVYSRG
jgi:hypothetical protein